MIKLCGFAVSNYFNKVKIALIEKGIAFEEEHCGISQEPAMLARSPLGKIPFLDFGGGRTLCESQVILEYLEETHPEKPLYPRDPFERARVRELITILELNLELVARRTYRTAFFDGKPLSEEIQKEVSRELAKGARAFGQRAKFAPFVAGDTFGAADCAAAVHLPLINLAHKTVYGADLFAGELGEAVKRYQKMIFARASVARVQDDRKAALAAREAEKAAKAK